MVRPPFYDEAALEILCKQSRDEFRRIRLQEPLEEYLDAYDEILPIIEELLEETVDLSELNRLSTGSPLRSQILEVLRSLAGPPISKDDFNTLVGVKVTNSAFKKDPQLFQKVVEIVIQALDKRRFPWVSEGREPEESESVSAKIATASLIATRIVGTKRRNVSKTSQEGRVEAALSSSGFSKVKTRKVETIADAPRPKEFCRESKLGSRKADFLIGLGDRRILALECKVSNSAVNSFKRVNKEALSTAGIWRGAFGTQHLVPAAFLSGVYTPNNLLAAQSDGLTLFWDIQITEFITWVNSTF